MKTFVLFFICLASAANIAADAKFFGLDEDEERREMQDREFFADHDAEKRSQDPFQANDEWHFAEEAVERAQGENEREHEVDELRKKLVAALEERLAALEKHGEVPAEALKRADANQGFFGNAKAEEDEQDEKEDKTEQDRFFDYMNWDPEDDLHY